MRTLLLMIALTAAPFAVAESVLNTQDEIDPTGIEKLVALAAPEDVRGCCKDVEFGRGI